MHLSVVWGLVQLGLRRKIAFKGFPMTLAIRLMPEREASFPPHQIYSCLESLCFYQQDAFEKCWAHSPLRSAKRRLFYIAIHQVSLLSHAATVARRLRIDVHNNIDNNDNAWQRQGRSQEFHLGGGV